MFSIPGMRIQSKVNNLLLFNCLKLAAILHVQTNIHLATLSKAYPTALITIIFRLIYEVPIFDHLFHTSVVGADSRYLT